jgi:hypothetical protein
LFEKIYDSNGFTLTFYEIMNRVKLKYGCPNS